MRWISRVTWISPISLRSNASMSEKRTFEIDVEPRYIARESDPDGETLGVRLHHHDSQHRRRRGATRTTATGSSRTPTAYVRKCAAAVSLAKNRTSSPASRSGTRAPRCSRRRSGSMQGHYEFEADGGERFLVPIPVFSLSVPNLVH